MPIFYPVEIKEYQVHVKNDAVEILLKGSAQWAQGAGDLGTRTETVASITFRDAEDLRLKDFINRGGFLSMDRPLSMFSGILDLLRGEKPLYLRQNGTISTSLEPVGEQERALLDPA